MYPSERNAAAPDASARKRRRRRSLNDPSPTTAARRRGPLGIADATRKTTASPSASRVVRSVGQDQVSSQSVSIGGGPSIMSRRAPIPLPWRLACAQTPTAPSRRGARRHGLVGQRQLVLCRQDLLPHR